VSEEKERRLQQSLADLEKEKDTKQQEYEHALFEWNERLRQADEQPWASILLYLQLQGLSNVLERTQSQYVRLTARTRAAKLELLWIRGARWIISVLDGRFLSE